jgi:hypothetical protein
MDASKIEQISSVTIKRTRVAGMTFDFPCFHLVVVFKNYVTKEEACAFGFRDFDPSTKVEVLWERQSHGEADGSADKSVDLNKVEHTRDIEDDKQTLT